MNRVIPFWMLNDKLSESKLISQLQQIKNTGISELIVHPRFGLETIYLSPEWFKAIETILDWSKSNNFKIWIYDELNWPSGYAGGEIIKNNKNLVGKCLIKTRNGFKIKQIGWKAAYSNYCYTDLLNPKTTDLFIKYVHEAYYSYFKKYFGKTLIGFFTDEPGLYCNFSNHNNNSLPWTENFLIIFKALHGYELRKHMNSLWADVDMFGIQYRVDYWKTICFLYHNNYFKKLRKWCHSKNILFIGHLLAEESLVNTIRTQGDFFGAMKFLDWAGYDLLSGLEKKHIITAKLAASVQNNYGLTNVCAETFGVFGDSLSIDQMKSVSNWQMKNGLTVSIPHAFFYSVRGKRKYDCPPSFFEQKYINNFNNYVGNILNNQPENKSQNNNVAIFYPKETIWGELLPNDISENNMTEQIFNDVIISCYNCKINFNIIDTFVVCNKNLRQYDKIILPDVAILDVNTLSALKTYSQKGKLISVGRFAKYPTKVADRTEFNRIKEEILYTEIPYVLRMKYSIVYSTQELVRKIFKKLHLYRHTTDISESTQLDKIFNSLLKN